jgi:hypothetical protein
VISDCRFPNEIRAIRDQGGVVIRVVRGPEPEWYDDAVAVNAGPKNMRWAIAKEAMTNRNIHASETAWVGTDFNAVIDNNGTMDQLYQQINDLLQDLRDAKANPLD